MKRWLLLGIVCVARVAFAQTYAPIQNYCSMGGVSALTSGLSSTNKLLGIVPSCTVTVYLTGTTTLATIYSNSAGTSLPNPFTATNLAGVAPGQWIFFVPAASSQAYDVVLSGGIPPNVYVNPVTLTGVSLGGGAGGSSPPQYSVQFATTNGAFGSDSCITINPSTHTLSVCGGGTGQITINGGTSGYGVTQTVSNSTSAWTLVWPSQPPAAGTGANCLVAYPSGTNAPANWTSCSGGPFNPTNSTTYIGGPMPPTTLKATDYGALCNSTGDDGPAINNALAALARVVGILQSPPQPMQAATVMLPQGRCVTSVPIVAMNYGSLQGSGNGTWIAPTSTWSQPAGTALVNIAESYTPNGTGGPPNGQSDTAAGRFVKDINFEYNGSASQITGIKVYNQTGTATTPYPSTVDHNAQGFQIPNVTIQNVYFYAMDTGIDLEDCGNCTLYNVNTQAVRQGFVNGGNNYSVEWFGGNILQGTLVYTPATGSTYGVNSFSETRYSCTGGAGAACTGGTIAQDTVVSPQTFQMSGVTVESFTYDAYIPNCLNFIAFANGFDAGGTAAMYLGPVKLANVFDNFMAVNGPTGDGIQVAGTTSAQGAGLANQDGIWIYDNQVYAYVASSGSGINFLSGGGTGTSARRNSQVYGNQLTNWATGINVQSPLTYSLLTGNYGNTISTQMFNFPVTATGSYANTVLRDNMATSGGVAYLPLYTHTSGSGLVVGYNVAGNTTYGGQLLGTQKATGSGCSVTSTPNNSCLATLTIANPFLESSVVYSVQGCQMVGASANVYLGNAVLTNNTQFSVYEVSTGTAASGGTITCTVTDDGNP